jgi:hypothetical protein
MTFEDAMSLFCIFGLPTIIMIVAAIMAEIEERKLWKQRREIAERRSNDLRLERERSAVEHAANMARSARRRAESDARRAAEHAASMARIATLRAESDARFAAWKAEREARNS